MEHSIATALGLLGGVHVLLFFLLQVRFEGKISSSQSVFGPGL